MIRTPARSRASPWVRWPGPRLAPRQMTTSWPRPLLARWSVVCSAGPSAIRWTSRRPNCAGRCRRTSRVTNRGDYLVVNMPQDLLFATDSASVRPDLTRDLKTVAASLLKYPNSRIEVIGHTDNSGSAAYNQDLSQRRAVSVANVLRESGVPNGRIAAYGRGEDQPSDDQPDARRPRPEPPGRDHHPPATADSVCTVLQKGAAFAAPFSHCRPCRELVIISNQYHEDAMPFLKVTPEKLSTSVVRQIEAADPARHPAPRRAPAGRTRIVRPAGRLAPQSCAMPSPSFATVAC